MKRKLPPLNALRFFEAAARHSSFTLAAEELNVTQTAVSKQVARLEAHLGQKLFVRAHRSLTLTEVGENCAMDVAHSLDHIERKLTNLGKPKPSRVTILTDVDFARLWLFPILPELGRRFPNILISLETKNYTQPIKADEEFDIAISWGRGKWHDITFEPLFTNEVFPVCAPGFFGSAQPDMSQIPPARLIHDRNSHWWRVFLDRANIDTLDAEIGHQYTQTSLCLDAAVRGDGIAIGDEVTTRKYLEEGTLIAPFPDRIPTPDAYYLLLKAQLLRDEDPVQQLRGWLLEEAAKHRLWFSSFWAKSPT